MIDDVPVHLLRDAIDFHRVRFIDCIEQRWKRVAEIKAATAAVADIEDTFKLLKKRSFVVKFFRLPVERVPCRRL
jgi:hypothetical protein